MNTIFNEDCLITMANLQSNSVDTIITSPPYNTSRANSKIDPHSFRYDEYYDDLSDDEYINWTLKIFNGYDKILKKDGVVLYNLSYSSENTDLIWKVIYNIIEKTNFTTADTICWKKKVAIPNNVSPNKLTRITEFIFVFCRKDELKTFKSNKKIISQSKIGQNIYENLHNFIEAPNNDGTNELNKATFSTDLVRQLIKMYCLPNSTIYDSFMGIGTTAVAAKIENMAFIGSELSKNQCDYANNRINKVTNNINNNLF